MVISLFIFREICYYEKNVKGVYMKSTKFWVVCIALLLLVSCAASIFIYQYKGSGTIASIYQSGELVKQIHLETVTSDYSFVLEGPNGGENTIGVSQGKICVSDASCPDHVCVKTGWISDGVVPIVCLPNELVIKITDSDSDAVDASVQ